MDALLEFTHTSPLAIWGLFALLVLCGVGLPMPEDVILVAAGMLSAERESSWIFVSALMYIGVIFGDGLIFTAGRQFGSRLLESRWMKRWISDDRRERISRLLNQYGSAAFFIARFMPGVRSLFFCTAGAMRVSYSKFLLFDGLAALVSVPLFVWLGSFLWRQFGDDLGHLSAAVARTHSYTLWFAVGLIAVTTIVLWLNRRRLVQVTRN